MDTLVCFSIFIAWLIVIPTAKLIYSIVGVEAQNRKYDKHAEFTKGVTYKTEEGKTIDFWGDEIKHEKRK